MPACTICKNRKTRLKYKKNNYRYYQCGNCLSFFLFPVPSEKNLAGYYKDTFDYSSGKTEEKRLQKRASLIVGKMISLGKKNGTLLDVGSGYGYLVRAAKGQGLKITGIEPSRALYSSSKALTGVKILNTDFCSFVKQYKGTEFDYITLVHVIEHVPKPVVFLKMAVELLKVGGILYVETPNANSWLAKAEKENYTFLTPPDHLSLFTPQSFMEIFRSFKNIEIKSFSTYSQPEHLMGILKKKLQMLNPKSQTNSKSQISNSKTHISISLIKKIKYLIFDRILAKLVTPVLNINNKGSIIETYVKKISD